MAKNRFKAFEGFDFDPSSLNAKKKTGKSSDPRYAKVTVYLSKDLHYRLRSHTLLEDEDMSELIERVMADYFRQLDA